MDIGDAGGRRLWEAAGRPPVPAVTVEDVTTTISTMSQLAAAVGAPAPDAPPVALAAGETLAILDAWVAHLRAFDGDLVAAPTASRGRSVAELTVNVFAPLELLPGAWETGTLPWRPEQDAERAGALLDAGALTSWAAGVARAWGEFLAAHEPVIDAERTVESPRGRLEWAPLVAAQRWHAAYHYRQLVAFARARGAPSPDGALALDSLRLELPEEVY